MYLQLLTVLVLAYTAQAEESNKCMNPEAMQHFDMDKFAGKWHEMAYASRNETDRQEYKDSSCVQMTHTVNGDNYDATAQYLEKGESKEKVGKYHVADKKIGKFKIAFDSESNRYSYRVVCCDPEYNHYCCIYTEAQYDDKHCSEYAVVMSRDRNYENLKNNEELKKCMQDKLHMTWDQMIKIKQDDCH